jgi:hypothetical protein
VRGLRRERIGEGLVGVQHEIPHMINPDGQAPAY